MEQVLMNLVVNAQDAMPHGGTLTIETANLEVTQAAVGQHTASNPGHYVQLAVTDTGHGMDKQTQSRLFDPFFSTKGNGKGTGLGLATVYGIVKQSGGNIWVKSNLGLGTTFRLELPRDLTAVARTTTIPPAAKQTAGNETILVVEDQDALREVAKRTLAAAGYHVLDAANGDAALQLAMQYTQPIHLLLTDVVMPQMDGRTLAQELLKTRPTVAVLYMSGHTAEAFVLRGGLDAGAHFIGKPFTAPALALKVREVLDECATSCAGISERRVRVASQPPVHAVDEAAFRMLPRVMLSRLREAANNTSRDKIIELLERLQLTEPDVANALRRKVDQLDYDGILDLLGRQKASGSR
jgi:DNA-binding response OmpR family regulator